MPRTVVFLVAVLLVAVAAPAIAADNKKKKNQDVVTDPAKAGPDYQIQGEYAGEVQRSTGPEKWGAQVIAMGDGKFHVTGYKGGLPGDGWDKGDKDQVDGKVDEDGIATFIIKDGHIVLEIEDGKLKVLKNGTKLMGTLKKVERKSPTLGAKPPKGAVVLFDGSSPDAFKGGRMTEDGLLMEGVTSKDNFGSFELHLEFRTPFKPKARGQGRGNSGFYAQGRYEVQILDSFGLEGKQNECGGVYSIGAPSENMCYPPLCWQTYDIDFTAAEWKDGKKVKNAQMTVRHNGVVIHKDLELPKSTTAAPVKESDQPGPVFLQNHGNPVRFRNIWVKEKK